MRIGHLPKPRPCPGIYTLGRTGPIAPFRLGLYTYGHMRLALAVLLPLLPACTSTTEYERGTPTRPATPRPGVGAPTVGQPGTQQRTAPRTSGRFLPPEARPGLWAEAAPRATFSEPDPATPREYQMGIINNPVAVPDTLWQRCWMAMFDEFYGRDFLRTARLKDGASARVGMDAFSEDEMDCARAEWMRECATSGGASREAQAWLAELVEDRCDSDKGGTPRAVALGRLTADKARAAGKAARARP